MADKKRLPFCSVWEKPLTNEIATTIVVERVVRIALLPPALRDDLVAEVRTRHDSDFFDHLDIELEVAGLALRDGWDPSACPVLESGRQPDLRLTRPEMQFTLEVTGFPAAGVTTSPGAHGPPGTPWHCDPSIGPQTSLPFQKRRYGLRSGCGSFGWCG